MIKTHHSLAHIIDHYSFINSNVISTERLFIQLHDGYNERYK